MNMNDNLTMKNHRKTVSKKMDKQYNYEKMKRLLHVIHCLVILTGDPLKLMKNLCYTPGHQVQRLYQHPLK